MVGMVEMVQNRQKNLEIYFKYIFFEAIGNVYANCPSEKCVNYACIGRIEYLASPALAFLPKAYEPL
jgi:hypothetical protein